MKIKVRSIRIDFSIAITNAMTRSSGKYRPLKGPNEIKKSSITIDTFIMNHRLYLTHGHDYANSSREPEPVVV
jgi:hypothetical protein